MYVIIIIIIIIIRVRETTVGHEFIKHQGDEGSECVRLSLDDVRRHWVDVTCFTRQPPQQLYNLLLGDWCEEVESDRRAVVNVRPCYVGRLFADVLDLLREELSKVVSYVAC